MLTYNDRVLGGEDTPKVVGMRGWDEIKAVWDGSRMAFSLVPDGIPVCIHSLTHSLTPSLDASIHNMRTENKIILFQIAPAFFVHQISF